MTEAAYIGEVIESTTTQFVAEARRLHESPPFGSFVRVESEPAVHGVVFNVSTHSIEPNRRPAAYGKSEEELRLEQPQIFELLKTEFHALIVGYRDGGGFRQILPPQPPRIHSFVYGCDAQEVAAFTSDLGYLRSVLGFAKMAPDELLIAVARCALQALEDDEVRQAHLVQMGKELSRLIREDYDRLTSLVRRIAQ
jgi:hypothetical protein